MAPLDYQGAQVVIRESRGADVLADQLLRRFLAASHSRRVLVDFLHPVLSMCARLGDAERAHKIWFFFHVYEFQMP
jgi:hypothetical protein